MKIGIRAHDMEKASLEDLVQNMNSMGFSCTQLALKKAIHTFNVEPEAMTPGMAFYIKEIFEKNKVDIAVLGCYLNLANPVEEQRKEIIETYKSHIRFASILGCGMVGTETGAMNVEYSYEQSNHSKEALEVFIESLKVVVDYSEKMGVIFGVEPVYKHIMSDIDRTYKVLSSVNSPNLQVIFDPVNLLSVNNYNRQDEIIKGGFQLFGRDIAVIHAKDFKVEGEEIISLPSGSGLLNYELLMSKIKTHKPFIHVLLEDTNPSNVVYAKEFVEKTYTNIV